MINKKALSPIIAYVILVTIVISTSLIVYPWLKTYVTPSPISCPDGVSFYLNQVNCSKLGDGSYQLNITIKNNGKFGIGGYFINFRDASGKAIPWNSVNLTELRAGSPWAGDIVQLDMKPGVNFLDSNSVANAEDKALINPFKPDEGENIINSFFVIDQVITRVELTPFRKEGDKAVIVSCGKAIKENVYCSE